MKKIGLSILILGLCCSMAYARWDKSLPASGSDANQIGVEGGANNAALDLILSNYRRGAEVIYNAADSVVVNAGEVVCSNSDGSVRLMAKNAASTTVTWTDIDTGSEATSTTYYVYAVMASVTDATFTCKISASATAPSGSTYYKRLGTFYNNSSGNIESITTYGGFGLSTGITNSYTAIGGANYGPTSTGEYYYLTIGTDSTGTLKMISGYASTGTAIPLPSGCAQANCHWFVSVKSCYSAGYAWYGYSVAIDASRIVTIYSYGLNWV